MFGELISAYNAFSSTDQIIVLLLLTLAFGGAGVMFVAFLDYIGGKMKSNNDQSSTSDAPDLSKVIIQSQDGTVLVEHTAQTDSLDWDGEGGGFIRFDNEKGEDVIIQAKGFLITVTDL